MKKSTTEEFERPTKARTEFLKGCYLLPSVRGDLLTKMGRFTEAREGRIVSNSRDSTYSSRDPKALGGERLVTPVNLLSILDWYRILPGAPSVDYVPGDSICAVVDNALSILRKQDSR
jgi:hypothetical protein